jgi:hypothetical protein
VSVPRWNHDVAHLRAALVRIVETLDAEGLVESEAYVIALAALHQSGPRSYRCDICRAMFAWPGEVVAHVDRVHGGSVAA